MVFGMFMAILDIQIVSASLTEIQAGLSASSDEVAWVQTSYLIAEVIMIPLSGILSRAFSTRWMFAVSGGGFTLMSFMCATSTAIDEMIVWRALQGFIGGGMIPTVFAAAFTIFPREKQPIVAPLIGLVATLAPTIGPTVGGYLTDLFSWHWLFLINVVPGIFVTVATWMLVDFDKPDLSCCERSTGPASPAWRASSARLEYVLEEGPKKDWFDETIVVCAVVSAARRRAVLLARLHGPAADRRSARLLRPQLRHRLDLLLRAGHRALRADLHLPGLPRAGARLLLAADRRDDVRLRPVHVRRRADRRPADRQGRSAHHDGDRLHRLRHRHLERRCITKDWDFWELLVPQMLRGFSLMTAMVPINNMALGTLPPAADEERLGPLQPHPQPRRRGRPRPDQHADQRPLGPASRRTSVAWGHEQAEATLANMTAAMASMGRTRRSPRPSSSP